MPMPAHTILRCGYARATRDSIPSLPPTPYAHARSATDVLTPRSVSFYSVEFGEKSLSLLEQPETAGMASPAGRHVFLVPTSGVVYKINTKVINKSPQAPGPRIISRRGGCCLEALAEAWVPLGLVLSSGKQSWQPDLGPSTSFTRGLVTRSCSWGGGGPTFFKMNI